MENICLFSSYSEKDYIDNYIKFYLEMLKKHFSTVIILTNKRDIRKDDILFLDKIGVSIKFVTNEGYDFGMWYKGLQIIDVNIYDQIAFVNDSCILFNDLDMVMEFVNTSGNDICGITDSNEISYHIQSYFMVANNKHTIRQVYKYYIDNGLIISNDIKDVINIYEIGMSQHMINNNYKVGSLFSYKTYNTSSIGLVNISLVNITDMIENGCPMIKKKLIYKTFRDHERSFLAAHNFDFNTDYITQIKKIIYPYNISIEYILGV